LKNYADFVLEDPLFIKSLYNTFYYVILSVPLGLLVALGLALLLNLQLRGVAIFRTIFYVPMVTPVVAVSLLWLFLFNPQFGILNYVLTLVGLPALGWISDPTWSKPSLILMSLWTVGGTMLIFLAGLQGIPAHLYEAAEIDGANIWQRFLNVTLPMLSPVIFFNLVLGIIGSFQTFTQAYVMTGGGPVDSTLFYALYLYRSAFKLLKMGYASSMAWVLLVIILVLTWLQFRLGRSWVYYEGEPMK
jgi:multiple sugar transport system permease protein